MTFVKESENETMYPSLKTRIIKELNDSRNIITNNLIPQIESHIAMYGIGESENLQRANNSDYVKQQQSKIAVLKTIQQNIDENLQLVSSCPTDNKHMLKMADTRPLESIFEENKDMKKSAAEFARAGLPDLKKVKVVQKPKKKGIWGAILMIVIGVVQVVAGYFLSTVS